MGDTNKDKAEPIELFNGGTDKDEGENKDQSKKTVAAAADTAEMTALKERLAAMEVRDEEREKQWQARMGAAEARANQKVDTTPASKRTQEQWEQLFQEKGFVGAMGAYENEVVLPALQGIEQRGLDRQATSLKKICNLQRDEIRRDARLTEKNRSDVLSRVDLIVGKLSLEDRADAGVYREALDQVLEAEEIAIMRMNGNGRRTIRTERGQEQDLQDGDGGELTKAQLQHARMFGITSKKEWDMLEKNREIEL